MKPAQRVLNVPAVITTFTKSDMPLPECVRGPGRPATRPRGAVEAPPAIDRSIRPRTRTLEPRSRRPPIEFCAGALSGEDGILFSAPQPRPGSSPLAGSPVLLETVGVHQPRSEALAEWRRQSVPLAYPSRHRMGLGGQRLHPLRRIVACSLRLATCCDRCGRTPISVSLV
ncbi:hypothetical protein BC628DRAFT_1057066 [Trametes gibbosa]|nr:hypothetical protein BC628DRAFT_1057066 [Trametes gibbosa]